MPRVTTVKAARKDIPHAGIKKGETYYWWKFRFGGKQYSKTYPKRSQLTRSSYLATLYDLSDTIGKMHEQVYDADSLDSFKSDVISTLEDLKSDCENNLENMPDSLRESSASGELLQERIDNLDNAISEFEDFDTDWDDEPTDEDLREEAINELGIDEDDEERDSEKDEAEIEAKIEELRGDKLREWIDEKIEEFQNIDLPE